MSVVIAQDQLQRKVEDLSNLPTLPGVVQAVCTMVEDQHTSAQDIGEIISRDQVLSAKLLRVVNSPVYGFPGRISSVTHAIVLLGFNVVKGLILSSAVFDGLASGMQGLWEHSLGVALVSRRMAKELKHSDAEEVMVAGLLHDLGKVVTSYLEPEAYRQATTIAEARHVHIAKAEAEVFGIDHTRVSSWLAWRWHLPERLGDALTYHHRPERAKQGRETTAIVHVADILARGMGYGSGGDPSMPPLHQETFQSLGLSFEQIDAVLADAEQQYAAGADIFKPGGN